MNHLSLSEPRRRRGWLYPIAIAASAVFFSASFGLQLFFSRSDYGFLYNTALLCLSSGSFIVLVISLTVWLYRRKLQRRGAKAAVSVTCALLSLLSIALLFGTIFFSLMTGRTLNGAGSISGNRYYLHTSPEGSNRLVILFGGMDEELIHAYPMLNAWVYKEADNGFVWSAHIQEDEYRVEWTSEDRAVVEVLRHDRQEVEGKNPDDRIVVDF